MSDQRWITLLTDFGSEDSYVGIMKGVIARTAPHAVVIDLGHALRPFDVVEGAFRLGCAYSYFPEGTIHVAVVDPGVGSERDVLALEIDGHTFLGPDNGVLGGVVRGRVPERIVTVTERRFFLDVISDTFHGRDIFAPCAAHLACGTGLGELGAACVPSQRTQSLEEPWPSPRPRATDDDTEPLVAGASGEVILCDRFGNCITNIPLPELAQYSTGTRVGPVQAAGRELPLRRHYREAGAGEPLALRGSCGYLEVAVRDGSAREVLGIDVGAAVSWDGLFPIRQ